MNLALLMPYRYGHCRAISLDYLGYYPDCITVIPFSGILSLLGVSPYHDPRPT